MINPQLYTFVSVAKCGSFSKAAEEISVSPTAVMKQIDALESRLGVTLFNRTNRGLILTAAGESVLSDAKYLVDYAARATEKAQSIERQSARSVRIGTSVMTPAKFILDIWTEIQIRVPDLKIELIPFENTPKNAREILKNLGAQIDVVAGIYDERFKQDRGVETVLLENKEISFAVPLNSPLASKAYVSPQDLETGAMFIKEGWNKHIDEFRQDCQNIGVKVIDFEFFNLAAFNEAVKNNVPIIAIQGWENVHPLLKLIPSKPTVTVPYGIMYSPSPSDQVKRFVAAVKDIVSNKR